MTSTYSPVKSRAKLKPTSVSTGPYQPPAQISQPPMRIDEPATLIGDWTGKAHLRIGDNPNGMERLTVTPPPGPVGAGQTLAPGERSAATGINAVVGVDPLQQQLQAKQSLLQAQGQQTDAQVQGLQQAGNVLGATAGTFAPQAAYTAASRAANQQQQQYTGAQAGYIGQQQQDAQQTQIEQQGIQAAAKDYADKTAVGQAQNARNNSDYLYGLAGEAAPTEVDTANGADNALLPPGTRAKLQTSEQLKTAEATTAQTNRGLSLKLASEAVALLGTNVDKAKEFAAEQGFNLDDAKLAVAKAQNAKGYADLNSENAGLNVNRASQGVTAAGLPPSAGMVTYTDPVTGASQWVTPGVKQGYDAQNQRDFNLTQPGDVLYTDPYTGSRSYMSQAEADQKKLDYEHQFGIANAASNANYQTAIQPAQNAAQSTLTAQYANDPASAPISYLLANMRPNTVDANGFATFDASGPGVFTRQQVIAALQAKGYTLQQAVDLTTPNPHAGQSGGSAE